MNETPPHCPRDVPKCSICHVTDYPFLVPQYATSFAWICDTCHAQSKLEVITEIPFGLAADLQNEKRAHAETRRKLNVLVEAIRDECNIPEGILQAVKSIEADG